MLQALENGFHIPGYPLWILSYYLKDHVLLHETPKVQPQMKVTLGAAEGFILSPEVWNALYDNQLRLEIPHDSTPVR